MADGVDEIGAVERVEVELADALVDQLHDLLGGDRRRNQLRGLRVVVEAVEAARQPGGHGGAAAPGEPGDLLEIVDRHDARHDRRPDAARARRLQEAEVVGVVEEELGDDAVGARVDLGFEVVHVGRQSALSGCFSG